MNILESSRYAGPFDTRKGVAIHSRNEKKKKKEKFHIYKQPRVLLFIMYTSPLVARKVVKCVGTKTRSKNAFNHYKNNYVLTDRRNLSGTRRKSASGKSSSCQFRSQPPIT